MIKKTWGFLSMMGVCAVLSFAAPANVQAAEVEAVTSTTWYAKIDAPNVAVRETADPAGRIISQAVKDQVCQVVEAETDGWLKVSTSDGLGYIQGNRATLIEKTSEKVDESVRLREAVVDYALSFVGNRYVYGGSDPHTGVDCSGFTSYVMRHVAGISLSHSSRAQAGEGTSISYSQAKPGDLIFYSSGSRIDHVAIYMGNGQIVHASSAKTGIKVSSATSRKPAKVVRVIK